MPPVTWAITVRTLGPAVLLHPLASALAPSSVRADTCASATPRTALGGVSRHAAAGDTIRVGGVADGRRRSGPTLRRNLGPLDLDVQWTTMTAVRALADVGSQVLYHPPSGAYDAVVVASRCATRGASLTVDSLVKSRCEIWIHQS